MAVLFKKKSENDKQNQKTEAITVLFQAKTIKSLRLQLIIY